jgi:uncharacterized membrane-anchored protein
MEIVAEIFLWIVFRPIVSGIHAIVGLLYPVKSAYERSIQWIVTVLLVLGVVVLIAGIVAFFWQVPAIISLSISAGGWFTIIVAGWLGALVERFHLERHVEKRGTSL